MRADVQLEHGYVRIANRLLEAILDNELSGAQQTILLALLRLTYGWRRKTVTCSQQELATYMRMGVHGNFRNALRELVANGVVIELEKGSGRTKSTWAIQKDFTRWGRFAVAPQRLEKLFGPRPPSNDDLLRQADLFNDSDAEGDHTETGRATTGGRADRPDMDGGTGSKSFDDETVAPPKDKERQGNTVVDDGALPEVPEYAIQLVVTANTAITKKWGEQPTVLHHGTAQQLAADLRDRGVLLDIARASILDQLHRRRHADGPPRSIHWFQKGIEQAWSQEEQRRLDATTPQTPAAPATAGTNGRRASRPSAQESGRAELAAWLTTGTQTSPSHGK